MATGPVTTATGTKYIPTLWSSQVIDAYEANTVMAGLADRSFEPMIRGKPGNKITVPLATAFTATTKSAEDDDATFTTFTETGVDISISTWAHAAYRGTDLVQIQALPSLLKQYTENIGTAIARKIDTDGLVLVASISQNTGTLNVPLTIDDHLEGRRLLDVANAPNEKRYMVVHPNEFVQMALIDQYKNSLYAKSGGNLEESRGRGFIADLGNWSLYESSNVVANGSGHDNVMFQQRWAALCIQSGPRVESWRNVTKSVDEVVGHVAYGWKEMRATSGVWMKGK